VAAKGKSGLLYSRILIKVSGEALMGQSSYGIDVTMVERIARDIEAVVELGAQLCIVVGGGNIFRGLTGATQGMDRVTADYMGMLATVLNCLALQNALEKIAVKGRVLSAIPMPSVCEPYIVARARHHLDRGRVLIFAAGTGNPFFTTDTTAALRAAEMRCDALIKGTQVDGVYDADPKTDKTANRFDRLTYQEVLAQDLKVMDGAAIALARDNDMPIIVCSIWKEGNLARVLKGKALCTTITTEA
jgi:uridylate kinase